MYRFDVGDIIEGYCNGFFGRDDYDDKVCVLSSSRFAVFVYLPNGSNTKGDAVVLNYSSVEGYDVNMEEWLKE